VNRDSAIEPIGVHHVSINVRDATEGVEFYTQVLGLRRRDDRPDFRFGGAWLDLGDQQVHLIEAPVPADHGQHFAIRVADIDAAVARLRGRGVEVSDPTPVATSRQCFLRDPSGNLIELHQPAGAT
jgi:glyoxylase I family protein